MFNIYYLNLKFPFIVIIMFNIYYLSYLLSNFFFAFFGGWHMEVGRLGVKLELQLLAYTMATAMLNPRCVCKLHHSSQQCKIPDPLSKARYWNYILMYTSWVNFRWTTMGNLLCCNLQLWNTVLLAVVIMLLIAYPHKIYFINKIYDQNLLF